MLDECVDKADTSHRFERVACLQLLGILNQETRNQPSGEAKISKPIGLTASWIWSHDPERYAIDNFDKARDFLVNGASFQNTNLPSGYTYKPWTIDEVLEKAAKGEFPLEGDWE